MSKQGTLQYKQVVAQLKKQYEGKMQVLCGCEADCFTDGDLDGFDYVIGSVHYLRVADGNYVPLDKSLQVFQDLLNRYFDGDAYLLAENYYQTVASVGKKVGANIVGHFDYVTKYNDVFPVIDEKNPRYVRAYQSAVDKLVEQGVVFEINTGGVSRGYKKVAYPSKDILQYVYSKGGKVVLTSDSHRKDTLTFQFDKYQQLAREIGFDV